MTIEEAIKRAEETAIGEDELCKRYDRASGYSRSHDETIRTTDAKRCEKIAQEHRQLAEWLKDYKRLLESSSEIPNKSIEEKCPCYHCEYFEIKGWSHCKIHEDAYGDSRCNDYHKVSQDLTKVKQDSNKSEIPTGSDDCISRQDVLSEIIRFSAEEGASVECQQLYCDVNNMPSVTPIRPKGHWCPQNDDYFDWYECSECGYGSEGEMQYSSEVDVRTNYCPNCGADMRTSEENDV